MHLTLPQVRAIASLERDGVKLAIGPEQVDGARRFDWSWRYSGGRLFITADGEVV